MALRLELDFDKKKESTPVLDLTRFRITTRQEFDKVFEKVPDYKIKPEKVRYDEVKIQDSHFTFVPPRTEILAGKEAAGGGCATGTPEFPFGNPVPPSMRAVRIEDLSSVDINWRMLTLARPKTKLEEDIFSRFCTNDFPAGATPAGHPFFRTVRYDEVKIQDSHFTFVPPRAEILAGKEAAGGGCATGTPEFPFGNPVPPSMRAVRIEDLSSVDINWRMLTLARPKTKLEEDIFSRFVALDKMKRKTRQAEGDQVPPLKQLIQGKTGKGKNAKSAGRAGGGAGGAVPETRFPSCKDCGEELCSGACKASH
ncbi:unnamed protein product [Notodromas monacha]|uniref:Uncharacterized protein n=1 Tax=Notodromas monacha TaxID=399045 RepID=A0A7R9BPK3_9CRUS|nr:unnamed protein product [Notodromas monacha]CAG0919287.1 unnamed protein product [Notodromas monacha]